MNQIETLITQCSANAACAKGMRDLKQDLSTQELSALFFKYSDFCIKNNTPTLDLLRSWRGSSEAFGFFVDDEIQEPIINATPVALNGACKMFLDYDGFTVSRVYIRHNSKAAISVSDNAILDVDLFDDAHLVISTAGDNARVTVNLYNNATVETIGLGIRVNKFDNPFNKEH